jgi:hypothetical protein
MLISALLGAIAGFFGVTLLFRWTAAPTVGGSAMILSGVGVAYLAMALFVGIGTLMPRTGSKVLNVEDSDELVEDRQSLLGSSLANGVLGVMMIVLANSGTGGAVPASVAVGTVIAALAVSGFLIVRTWKYQDELMRQVSLEAASIAGAMVIAILLVWGAFSMNGIGPAIEAKSMIALVMGMTLLGAFVATGARGMLTPR